MKRILLVTLLFIVSGVMALSNKPCGKYKGRNIYEGKEGGCYYLKGKEHRKIYIERKNLNANETAVNIINFLPHKHEIVVILIKES